MTGVSDTGPSVTPVSVASSIQYATAMTYDALNRPTGATFGDVPAATAPTTAVNVAFIHGYNAVNQRTSQAVSDSAWIDYPPATASTTGYTANSLNQYTAVGGVTPSYDGNGNTTSDGTITLGYDAENRLTSATKTGMTAAYSFDGRGRRKTRTVNGTTTVFVTDADNREVLEYDGSSGATLRWYAYGLGSNDVLAQVDVPGGTRLTPVPDLQGSIVATMSNAGTLTSFAYRPYGSSASAPAQFGYTGQRIDAETGSYYNRARQYSSGWGRFWQADPIGHAGGMHLYAYVSNDPLNLSDPDGWAAEGFAAGFRETFIGDESLNFFSAFANGSTSFRIGASTGFIEGFVSRTAAEAALYLAGEAWLRDAFGILPASNLLSSSEDLGGHLLARHVAQTEGQLAARLAAEPNIAAASTFVTRTEADSAAATVLGANSARIQS